MKNSSFSKSLISAIILSVLAVGIPAALTVTVELPSFWIVIGVLVSVVFASAVLPPYLVSRLARKRKATHSRITVSRRWQSPLRAQKVLQDVVATLGQSGTISHLGEASVEVLVGSDEEFRKWGVYSNRGRGSIPAVMTINVDSNEHGSLISVEARDNLGWFLGPISPRVKREVKNTLSRLLDELAASLGLNRPTA